MWSPFCVLFCLQFITRKVRQKPFNIVQVTSAQTKLLFRFWRMLLSIFKTVIVSSSVIVSSIIRQSFSTCSTLCQTFVIVLLNSEIQLQLCHLRR